MQAVYFVIRCFNSVHDFIQIEVNLFSISFNNIGCDSCTHNYPSDLKNLC